VFDILTSIGSFGEIFCQTENLSEDLKAFKTEEKLRKSTANLQSLKNLSGFSGAFNFSKDVKAHLCN